MIVQALALLLFLAFTLGPALKTWFTTLHDDLSIGAAAASDVVIVGDPNSCSLWDAFSSAPEHERTFVVEMIRNDRRDDSTGSEIRPV